MSPRPLAGRGAGPSDVPPTGVSRRPRPGFDNLFLQLYQNQCPKSRFETSECIRIIVRVNSSATTSPRNLDQGRVAMENHYNHPKDLLKSPKIKPWF